VAAIFKVRSDLWPLIEFARTVGKRKTNSYTLEWDQVDWDAGTIKMMGKGRAGGKPITVKITPSVRTILQPLQGQHPTRVFTMVAQRTVHPRLHQGRTLTRGPETAYGAPGTRSAGKQA
jgi:integrase